MFVAAGTLLLEIDPRDYELEVERLLREVAQAGFYIDEVEEELLQNDESISLAQRQVELSQREVTRLETLKANRVITESEHDRALRDELTAINTLTQLKGQQRVLEKRKNRLAEGRLLAETQLEKVRIDLARTRIVAPFDGVIVSDPVEQDSYVAKGTLLVTIEDTSAAEVRTNLRMDEVARVWGSVSSQTTAQPLQSRGGAYDLPDVPAKVVFELGDRQFQWEGVLSRQEGGGLDARTRTLPCRVLVPDPGSVTALDRYGQPLPQLPLGSPTSLLRGMFVQVEVLVEAPRKMLAVPIDAVRPSGDIWLLRNEELVIVRPTRMHATDDAVLYSAEDAGLLPGDRVIVSQLANPYDGMAVTEEPLPTMPDAEAARPATPRLAREEN
jgi:multidrug efflux pump subunit AcrA (membrane-fusion protein)